MSLTSTQLVQKAIINQFHWTIDLELRATLKKKKKLGLNQRCLGKHMLMNTCFVRMKVIISLLRLLLAKMELFGLNLPIFLRFYSKPTSSFARFHLGSFWFLLLTQIQVVSEFSSYFIKIMKWEFLLLLNCCIFGELSMKTDISRCLWEKILVFHY